MERLAFVGEEGQVLFENPAGFPEDVGFTIRELAENEEWEVLDNIAQRLANYEQRLKHYEDLEGQGRLLRLPCAVGDTVYYIRESWSGHEIDKKKFKVGMADKFNKTVFLTKPEAEAKLAEMEGKK